MMDLQVVMSPRQLLEALRFLHLSPKEAAELLSVTPKTVNRWLEGEVAVSGPCEQAVRAWERLERARLPWRPDGLPLQIMTKDEIDEQITLLREHAMELDEVRRIVLERGGPAAPWRVDFKKRRAVLGDTMEVHFHPLLNGGFSLSSYRRIDKNPDYERDRPLIHDAVVCIADAVAAAGSRWAEEH